jgi:hypothetical protein
MLTNAGRSGRGTVERVEAYRQRVPSWWFRIVSQIMTDPE